MTFPKTDRAQAQRQLELLGYKPNEAIYLRFFYASNDPRKEDDRGRKLNHLEWGKIERFQKEGRGVYFVINGGGHRNDDVKKCSAIFIEHDDLDKETQKELWRSLNLPEPTFQVDTGGKSIHSYWVFDQPIPVKQWCELQRDLLKYAQADQSIKNPARVMRLAGGWHISHKDGQLEYHQSQLISEKGTKYSYETLRGMIPTQKKESTINLTEALAPYPEFLTGQPLPHHPDNIQVPVSVPIPLLECCRKEVREQVNFGVPKGSGRNDAAIAVALELISVERYLQSIGQSYSETARQLFSEFCQRSEMSDSENIERWNWCEGKNPSPSCGEDGISACIRGWYWNEVVKTQRGTQQAQSQKSKVKSQNADQVSETNPVNLMDEVRQIILKYDSESLQTNALMTLAEQLGKQYRDIEALAKILRREINTSEETVNILGSLQGNLQTFHQRLNLTRYLDPTLANPLIKAAIAMPTAPEYIFNTLLSVAGSLIGTKCGVIVNPDGGYTQPCIFWTGNIARSGQAKTPPQTIVLKPLEEMESAAHTVYQSEMDDYLANDKQGAVPIRQRRILNNVTIPQKLRLHGENKNGLLEYIDELLSDYARLNQYNRGKGDDLQQELGFFNGGATNYDRSDSHIFLEKTAFSKTGTFQWETLGKYMENETNFVQSGYLPRFLLCSILDAPDRYLNLFADTSAVSEFQSVVRSLYSSLENLSEQDYFLSFEAKQLFQAWNRQLIDCEKKETHEGLALVYSKIESYTARIALWLHIVNAVMRGEQPHAVISGQTMQSAIEIAMFYLGQHKLVHAHNSPERQLEGLFLKVQTQAQKIWDASQSGVTASWLKTRLNALKKWGTEQIREKLLLPLAAQGFGRIEGKGSKMVYIPEIKTPDPTPTDDHHFLSEINNISITSITSTIGEELVTPPIAESQSVTESLDLIGGVDDLSNQVSGGDVTDEINNVYSTGNNTNEIKDNPPEIDVQRNHQNTNQSDSILDEAMSLAIGDTTQSTINLPPITNHPQVKWLLSILEQVEKVAVTGSQFTCIEQITTLMNQVESVYQQCEEQINQVCADYCQRLWNAIAIASQRLPETNG